MTRRDSVLVMTISQRAVLYLDGPAHFLRQSSLYQSAVLFPWSLVAECPGHLPTLLPPAPPDCPAPPARQVAALETGLLTPLLRTSDTAARDDGPDSGVSLPLPLGLTVVYVYGGAGLRTHLQHDLQ